MIISRHKALLHISFFARIILGLVFIIGALSKGIDPVRWGRQIEILIGTWGNTDTYLLIPAAFAAGCLILMIEFTLGVMLIVRCKLRLVSAASFVLLIAFALVIALEWFSGQSESCGCFGAFIERTPLEAILEDLVFIILAVLVFSGSEKEIKYKKKILFVPIAICLIWIIGYSVFPVSSAVIRTGSEFQITCADPDQVLTYEPGAYLIWVFDPECSECIAETENINKLVSYDMLPRLYGVTDATAGRLQEFLFDFEPVFPVIRISRVDYKQIFLPAGSLILIDDDKVRKIWRPKLMPPDGGDIISLIQN